MRRYGFLFGLLLLWEQQASFAIPIVTWLDESIWISPGAIYLPPEFELDVNEDGVPDFYFYSHVIGSELKALGENRFVGTVTNPLSAGWIYPLYSDYEIGSELKDGFVWDVGAWGMIWQSDIIPLSIEGADASGDISPDWLPGGPFYGPFVGHTAYIGIALDLDDGIHYGWIKVNVEYYRMVGILGWAYEDEPGVPIIVGATDAVPEPSTLALLALAIPLLAAKRRRRQT